MWLVWFLHIVSSPDSPSHICPSEPAHGQHSSDDCFCSSPAVWLLIWCFAVNHYSLVWLQIKLEYFPPLKGLGSFCCHWWCCSANPSLPPQPWKPSTNTAPRHVARITYWHFVAICPRLWCLLGRLHINTTQLWWKAITGQGFMCETIILHCGLYIWCYTGTRGGTCPLCGLSKSELQRPTLMLILQSGDQTDPTHTST